jgi:hypothetical protein
MKIDRAVVEQMSKELADAGKLVEAGWIGYRYLILPEDASDAQVSECKTAFMAGATHLFSSLMTILEPGDEPTADDMKRMDTIHNELQHFANEVLRSVGH